MTPPTEPECCTCPRGHLDAHGWARDPDVCLDAHCALCIHGCPNPDDCCAGPDGPPQPEGSPEPAAEAPPPAPVSRCRSCGAPVWWVMTKNGRRMPVDPTPDPRGTLRFTGNTTLPEVAVIHGPHEGPRYLSHFATCPNARQHRR